MAEDIIVKGTSIDEGTTKTPEQIAAEEKTKADAAAAAALLDENGNPKSEEVIAAEKAAAEEKAKGGDTGDKSGDKKTDDLKTKVETRAKQVEDLVKAADVVPSELIAQADKETGEISVAHKAKLIEKHGEAIADLIEGNIQKMVADIKGIGAAKDNAVFSQLEAEFEGITEQTGKETWTELSGWVKDNVEIATRKEYNKMLDQGGLAATLAIKEMVSKFKAGNDVTVKAELLDGDQASTVTTGGMITRAEYNTALDKLINAGHDYETSPEVAALNRKRTKSMNAGH